MSEQAPLFVNAAIQNQDYNLDDKPYKATGILAARALNHMVGIDINLHAWNTVGVFNDLSTLTPDERLAKKYDSDFMRNHLYRWQDTELDVLRDDDMDFAAYAVEVLKRSIEAGSVGYKQEDFTSCSECGIVIAEVSAGVSSCPRCCSDSSLRVVEEVGLFSVMPDDRKSLLPYHKQFNKINLKHEIKTLENIPPRVLLSRDRESGIDLADLDLPGKKLDPRLGIGLLALYSAQKHNYDNVSLVQSSSTLIRTVPYLSSVINDVDTLQVPEYSYSFHAKISPELFAESKISYELLALQSMAQRHEVESTTVDNLCKLRESIRNRFEQLENFVDESSPMLDLNSGNISSIMPALNKDLGRAVNSSKIPELYDWVGATVNRAKCLIDLI